MTVTLTSPVLGKPVGDTYTGPLESWLLSEGYARRGSSLTDPISSTATAAVLTGSSNAATLSAAGTLVLGTKGGVRTTVSLASGDTASAAAGKIDTAMSGKADAAIVSGKLVITSTATGPKAFVSVVGGTPSVLASLGLAVGQYVYGGDGLGLGASPTGPLSVAPASDPTSAANREAPYWPDSKDRQVTIANDADNLNETKFPAPGFDFDAGSVDTEAPVFVTLEPAEGPEDGGTKIVISGDNLEGVTGVTFGGQAGVDLDVSAAGQGVITVVTPAGTAGAVDVVIEDPSGDETLTDGFTYTA